MKIFKASDEHCSTVGPGMPGWRYYLLFRRCLLLLFIVLHCFVSTAQYTPKTMVYIGGEYSVLKKSLADSLRIGSYTGITLQGYIPFYSNSKFSIGINAGGSTGKFADKSADSVKSFLVSGAPYTSKILKQSSGSNKAYGFKAGPQVQFALTDKLWFSFLVTGGITKLTTGENAYKQVIARAGRIDSFSIRTEKSVSSSGFSVSPQVRLQYFFTPKFGIWVGGFYETGGNIKTQTSILIPEGQPNLQGQYNLQQLAFGKQETRIGEGQTYSATGAQAGVIIGFGSPGRKPEVKQPTGTGVVEPLPVVKITPALPKETGQNCPTYTSPVILQTDRQSLTHMNADGLHIKFIPSNALAVKYRVIVQKTVNGKKKIVKEIVYERNFNGVIKMDKVDEKENTEYSVQMQALPGTIDAPKTDKEIFQQGQCAQFENNGFSNEVSFSVSSNSSCAADYQFFIDSAKCDTGRKVKVYCHVVFLNINSIPSPSPTMNNVSFVDNATNLPFTTSNFSTSLAPLSLSPVGSNIPFSFDIDGSSCDKTLRITYDINWNCPSGPQHINACIDSFKLPCCFCAYCEKPENSNIQNISSSATLAPTDNLNIQQVFNVGPLMIGQVTAEIVYMQEDSLEAACRQCRKNENETNHFVGSNTLAWGTGAPIVATPANAAMALPTKILEWHTNNIGAANFNFTIALPGTAPLTCCIRHGRVCIRYSFTDINCKTCTVMACYNY